MIIDTLGKLNFAELVARRGKAPHTATKEFIKAFFDDRPGFESITYRQFYQRSKAFGNLIRHEKEKMGIEVGRPFKVGTFMENCPAFLYLQAGCSFTNSTLVALNSLRVGDGIAQDVNTTAVDLLFVGNNLAEKVFAASGRFDGLTEERILIADGPQRDNYSHSVQNRLQTSPAPDLFDEQPLHEGGTAMIIFTSGTTGAPKGIEISWKKLVDVGLNSIKALKYTAEDVGYICTPLYHSNAMYLNYMPALISGAGIGLRNRFRAGKFVADLTQCGATVWNCVGKPVTYVLNTIRDKDCSHLPLRAVISTGTTADEQERFTRLFGLELFIEAYGSTETGAITVKKPDDAKVSVGRRNPAKPFYIMSEDRDGTGFRRELKVGETGEIAVDNEALGDSAFRGYYGDANSTQKKLYRHRNNRIYYLTGDLGKLDAEENLYFMGRTGEWYRKKGENRSEAEAEEYLSNYKGIITLAAFGMPEATSQEDYLVAVIETDNPETFDIQGFVAYANRGDKGVVPDFIRLVTAMPKTATSKIVKHTLKTCHINRSGDAVEKATDVIYAVQGNAYLIFDREAYQTLMESYLPQSRERLSSFLERLRA